MFSKWFTFDARILRQIKSLYKQQVTRTKIPLTYEQFTSLIQTKFGKNYFSEFEIDNLNVLTDAQMDQSIQFT